MKRRESIGEMAFGHKLNLIFYMPPKETNDWVIFEHGSGEKGAADGSEIAKLERWGWPAYCKAGGELPFNLCAVQTNVTNFTIPNRVLAPHLILQYGAAPPLQTGLSMGGIGTYHMLWEDVYKLLCAIVPICGAPINSGYLASYAQARDIPVLAVHGDKDQTSPVQYIRGKTAAEKLNEVHPGQVEFITLPGVAHNAWVQAYDVNHPVGKRVLEFTLHALASNNNGYDTGFAAGAQDLKTRALNEVIKLGNAIAAL